MNMKPLQNLNNTKCEVKGLKTEATLDHMVFFSSAGTAMKEGQFEDEVETVLTTTIINADSIKLEPNMDQVIETHSTNEQSLFSNYPSEIAIESKEMEQEYGLCMVDKPKFQKSDHGLTIKCEIKKEPIDVKNDMEWDKIAEGEILAMNECVYETPPKPQEERKKLKIKMDIGEENDDDIDNPEGTVYISNINENWSNDDGGRSDDTYSPGMFENKSVHSLDNLDEFPDITEVTLIKEELDPGPNNDDHPFSRANGILASCQSIRIIEIGGYKVKTYGDYSKCPKCEKNIKSTFIIQHIKLHDLPTIVMKCPYEECTTSFTRRNNIYKHLKVIHNDDCPYICVYKNCSNRYSSSKQLRKHVNITHREEAKKELEQIEASNLKYKCDFPGCEREYGKKHLLKEHFRSHTGDMRYSCDVCGERFFLHSHMKRHLYTHAGIKPHSCRWKCGATFASYGGRMKHERAQHSENPYKLVCDICGRPFRFDGEVDKHKLTHLAPHKRMAYRCSYCGIIFDSISHRERHEQRHKDNDTFQCEDCNKMFKNEKNLRNHYKTHHEKPHPKTPDGKSCNRRVPGKEEKKEPPKYPCHLCDIPVMFSLTALRRHLARKHSTNYKCLKEGCERTFAKQYQLDAHTKLHIHRSCHWCGKQFKRKQNADVHLMGVHGLTKEDLITLGR